MMKAFRLLQQLENLYIVFDFLSKDLLLFVYSESFCGCD